MSAELRVSQALTLPSDAIVRTMAILAIRGSGKTYCAGVIAEEMLEAGAQIVVLDPIGVWWGLRLDADGRTPGYPIKVFGGLRGDLPLPPESGRLLAKLIVEKRFSAVLDISMLRKADRKRFAADFAEELFEQKKRQRSPLHLFLEEAHTFIPQITRKGEGVERMVGAFEDIGTQGRNYGLGLTVISQRPAAVAKAVLNQSECVFVLRILGKHERKALVEWMDEQDMPDKERLLAEVQSLPNGTACVWSPGWLGKAVKVQIRLKRTFDSSATPKAGTRRITASAGKLSAVDVEEIKVAMAEVIAKVEADDPAALRRRVVELERALAAKPAAAVVSKTIEVSVLDKDDLTRLERAITKLYKYRNAAAQAEQVLVSTLDSVATVLSTTKMLSRPIPPPAAPPPRPRPLNGHGLVEPVEPAQRLTEGERRVLTVLVQFSSATRKKAAILAGYAPGGSTMRGIMAALRRKQLVEEQGDVLVIHQIGKAALGGWTPLPTGAALRQHWLATLPECPSRLLGILADSYPEVLRPDEMEARSATGGTRYIAGGSTMRGGLARLRALDLVVDVMGGVRASEELF